MKRLQERIARRYPTPSSPTTPPTRNRLAHAREWASLRCAHTDCAAPAIVWARGGELAYCASHLVTVEPCSLRCLVQLVDRRLYLLERCDGDVHGLGRTCALHVDLDASADDGSLLPPRCAYCDTPIRPDHVECRTCAVDRDMDRGPSPRPEGPGPERAEEHAGPERGGAAATAVALAEPPYARAAAVAAMIATSTPAVGVLPAAVTDADLDALCDVVAATDPQYAADVDVVRACIASAAVAPALAPAAARSMLLDVLVDVAVHEPRAPRRLADLAALVVRAADYRPPAVVVDDCDDGPEGAAWQAGADDASIAWTGAIVPREPTPSMRRTVALDFGVETFDELAADVRISYLEGYATRLADLHAAAVSE